MNSLQGLATIVLAVLSASTCLSQGFNIDFDGNGLPRPAFGAAANQPGFWNYASYLGPLLGLDGNRTTVFMKIGRGGGGSSGSNYNPANTGEFAKLLNDAAQVGTIGQGGTMHMTFSGLQQGEYDVYTYSVLPFGDVTYAPIFVPQAVERQLQVVTGPMPGNSFEYLVTHSVHRVELRSGSPLEIIIEREPNSPNAAINGVQIVPIEAESVEAKAARPQITLDLLLGNVLGQGDTI